MSFIRTHWNSKLTISAIVLVLQIFIVINLMVVQHFSRLPDAPVSKEFALIFNSIINLTMTVFSLRLMAFYVTRYIWSFFFAVQVFSAIAFTVWVFPMTVTEIRSGVLKVSMIALLIVSFVPVFTIMILMLWDSLKEKGHKIYRLIGAANVYIGVATVFGLLFFIIELLVPGYSGMTYNTVMEGMYSYLELSFYGSVGAEIPFPNPTKAFTNVVVIETYFTQLFILVMIGRLVGD